jgi:phosphoserine phosphatase
MTTSTAGDRDTRVTTRRAAFFDVDKTLLPGSSLYLFARGLYRRGFYDLRDIAAFAFGQLVFRLTGAEGRRGMEAAREQPWPSSRASAATTWSRSATTSWSR